jgi:thiamine kinase-like enzyme
MIDQNEKLIKEKAAQAFKVKEKEVNVKYRLLGGMSHLTYVIEIANTLYTYRIIGKDGNLFVSRESEFENLKRIEDLHINNETVYFDVKTGEKAAKYVEGTVLSTIDYHPYLNDVAQTLKKLHHSDIMPESDYGLIERLNLYETYTDIRSDLYLDLKEKWVNIYLNERLHMPKVFCHNDAQRSNIVIAKDQIYLLDWEFAGLNEFYYDIASFGNVKFEDALELLDVYLEKKATKKEQDMVRFYRMFQALQWHQVALRKEMVGLSKVLHFDFKALSIKYLKLAETLYLEIIKG